MKEMNDIKFFFFGLLYFLSHIFGKKKPKKKQKTHKNTKKGDDFDDRLDVIGENKSTVISDGIPSSGLQSSKHKKQQKPG